MENKQPPAKRKTDQSSSPPAPPAKQQKKETTLESVASRCRDAISGSLLVDPVIAEDGHTYERSTIREWFRRCAQQPTSPLTHERMGTELRRNFAVRAIVEDLASSPGLGAEERAEWHVARGRLLCERQESKDGEEANKPDVRAARAAFERAARLVDEPPAGGHPGQAHNCRCYAEPVSRDVPNDITLVDYVPTDGGYPLQDLSEHEAAGGHTIALHVGKSEAFLIGMVTVPQARTLFYTVYRWRHGSFSSLAAAERLTNANLSRNADVVNAVATGREQDAFITSTFSSITGQEAYRLTRRASSPIRLRTTYGVGTYIRHAPEMPNGFIIITSYPRDE